MYFMSYFILILVFHLFMFGYIHSQNGSPSLCNSRRIPCSIEGPKQPPIYFSEISGARSYSKICRYGGRMYRLGWEIPVASDPCMKCVCNELWNDKNGLNSLSCKSDKCEQEVDDKLREGCVPVYQPGICCPIDYKCRLQCVYNGTQYPVGSKLVLNSGETSTCSYCQCSAPPTLTCQIHECPPKPPTDQTCHAVRNDSTCCAIYKCEQKQNLLSAIGCCNGNNNNYQDYNW